MKSRKYLRLLICWISFLFSSVFGSAMVAAIREDNFDYLMVGVPIFVVFSCSYLLTAKNKIFLILILAPSFIFGFFCSKFFV